MGVKLGKAWAFPSFWAGGKTSPPGLREEKPSPRVLLAGGKTSPWAYVQISRLSGRAEDGEGVGYLQGVLGEAETTCRAATLGAGGFTLTGGGELPAAS